MSDCPGAVRCAAVEVARRRRQAAVLQAWSESAEPPPAERPTAVASRPEAVEAAVEFESADRRRVAWLLPEAIVLRPRAAGAPVLARFFPALAHFFAEVAAQAQRLVGPEPSEGQAVAPLPGEASARDAGAVLQPEAAAQDAPVGSLREAAVSAGAAALQQAAAVSAEAAALQQAAAVRVGVAGRPLAAVVPDAAAEVARRREARGAPGVRQQAAVLSVAPWAFHRARLLPSLARTPAAHFAHAMALPPSASPSGQSWQAARDEGLSC